MNVAEPRLDDGREPEWNISCPCSGLIDLCIKKGDCRLLTFWLTGQAKKKFRRVNKNYRKVLWKIRRNVVISKRNVVTICFFFINIYYSYLSTHKMQYAPIIQRHLKKGKKRLCRKLPKEPAPWKVSPMTSDTEVTPVVQHALSLNTFGNILWWGYFAVFQRSLNTFGLLARFHRL
jgi:hypothetical protein